MRSIYTALAYTITSLLVSSMSAEAEIATEREMEEVCQNWLTYIVHQTGDWAGAVDPAIAGVTEIVEGGSLLGRCYSINPRGYVIVPVLKELPPVKTYSETSNLDIHAATGVALLLRQVLRDRIALFARTYGSVETPQPAPGQVLFDHLNRQEWNRFAVSPELFVASLQAGRFGRLAGCGPLLTTSWHQRGPYNDRCPEGDGRTCRVGCVATATAQIMAYHRWPPYGNGGVSYFWDGDQSCGGDFGGGELAADLSDGYNWSDMPDSCDAGCTPEEEDAVAELCYEVGVALEMDYGNCGSSASITDVPTVLPHRFYYDRQIIREDRDEYSADDWFRIIVEEIDAERPMVYRIRTGESSGHAIVCDGWRDTGGEHQYHINYGRGGAHTAWFAIDNIDRSYDPMQEYLLRNIKPGLLPEYSVAIHMSTSSYSGCAAEEVSDGSLGCEMVDVEGADHGPVPAVAWVLIGGVPPYQARAGGVSWLRFGIGYEPSVRIESWNLCTGGNQMPTSDWPASGAGQWVSFGPGDCYDVTENVVGMTRVGYLMLDAASQGGMWISTDPRVESIQAADCATSAYRVCPELVGRAVVHPGDGPCDDYAFPARVHHSPCNPCGQSCGDGLAPRRPYGCIASDDSCGAVRVTWRDNSDGELGFRVYRDSVLVGSTAPDVTEYGDEDALPYASHLYWVTAWNNSGESDPSNSDEGCRFTYPSPPDSVEVVHCRLLDEDNHRVEFELHWKDRSFGEDGQVIYLVSDTEVTPIDTVDANVEAVVDTVMLVAAEGDVCFAVAATNCDTLAISDVVCAEEVGGSSPEVYTLGPAVPNPFIPSVQISFAIPEQSLCCVSVYDASGRQVRRLRDARLTAGRHHVTWDGRDSNGRQVASGVYFVHMSAGEFEEAIRVVLLKR